VAERVEKPCGKTGPHCENGPCPNPECGDVVTGEWSEGSEFQCQSCETWIIALSMGDGSWKFAKAFNEEKTENKVVIVGELNPYHSDPAFALYHLPRQASGNRLREHLGLRDSTYAEIPKVNLCTGKWSMKVARDEREKYREGIFILLGAKVRDAFCGPPFFYAETYSHYLTPDKKQVSITLPHPSGLNRKWNEPGARERARELLRKHVPWIEWGEVS
jgi:hypothetical protein